MAAGSSWCFPVMWRRPIDVADAGCGKYEHGAGRLSRKGIGSELAADDGARADRGRVRDSDARSVYIGRSGTARNWRRDHQFGCAAAEFTVGGNGREILQ